MILTFVFFFWLNRLAVEPSDGGTFLQLLCLSFYSSQYTTPRSRTGNDHFVNSVAPSPTTSFRIFSHNPCGSRVVAEIDPVFREPS